MSFLTIVQSVCQELGINVPNAVATSSDQQIVQMGALLNKEGRTLASRPSEGWQVLQLEASFTTLATEIQGNINTIAPNQKCIINNTIWNRTNRRPIFGPLSPQQWQSVKGWFTTGPYSQYAITLNSLKFSPAPPAGQSCYFEYVTKAWATDSTGTISKTSFTADTDVSLLDEDLLKLGLMWRWKAQKGFEYNEDKIEYEDLVNQAIARDTPKPILNLSMQSYTLPNLYVQDGNFPS